MKTSNNMVKAFSGFFLVAFVSLLLVNCKGSHGGDDGVDPPVDPPTGTSDVEFWLSKADASVVLKKQTDVLTFGTTANNNPNIEVNDATTYQTIDGFGYTLTGGSAEVINSLDATTKASLLQELFGTAAGSIGVSYLRISIGASDLNASPFTYDDMPAGQTDTTLANFSLALDMNGVISLLKEILLINPSIKILGCPWSAPVWMKTNGSFIGGKLKPEYYSVYAKYFVKYIQGMQAQGITVDAVTPQNEPLNPNNNPSLMMEATEQAEFIKTALGPAFQTAGLNTKIIIWDHNCDNPQYPITVLNDPAAKAFVNGSAFHLYNGDISALSTVQTAHPDKALYFTEQYTPSNGSFGGDLDWHVKNVVIGSMRNWSRNALEWNLANNASYGPHTQGGCDVCKGAITVQSSSSIVRNVGYYIIGHASKFVPAGSVRIASNVVGSINNVAFKTPSGKKVLIVENDGTSAALFNIKYAGKWVAVSMYPGAVGTFIW